ncbi:acyl-CoA thioesterase [Arenibaculum pallidiluteum]|uniref:acyl-CoA thioesterase n=1 Tax=Arenibaculum pallidiluteum TaxID=2812559 RepID=UPI001A9628D4|nr:thioesterase family protein [Arenibaculum pallidiluteum]
MTSALPDRLPEGAFRARRLIRFSHCDPAGIVYFPVYFDMFNGLIEDWFSQCLGIDYASWILGQRRGMPIVHAECDFARPSRMGETLTLGIMVERIGRSSLSLRFLGEHEPTGEVRLAGRLVTVATSLETQRAMEIPDDLRAALERYREQCRESAHG